MPVALVLLASLASPWPQFGGPSGQGIVTDRLPAAIEPDRPAWRTELPGRGWSSPVIVGERAWMTTALDDGRDLRLLGVDLATGRLTDDIGLLQPHDVQEIHGQNSYASPTPCVWGDLVIAHFGRYGTAAYDTSSGEIAWTNSDYVIEHQGGPGSSPMIAGDTLILTLDGADESFVAGLDPATGQERWRRDRSAPKRPNPIMHRAFATPLVTEWDGRDIVVSPGADQLHAYDAATGEELWHVRYVGFSTVPQPVRWEDRIVLCTGFFKPSLVAVTLGGRGDVTDSHTAWTFKGPVPDIPSPVVANGHVWLLSDKGVLTAVDAATGKRTKALRVRGNYSASPLAIVADDASELLLANREGELVRVAIGNVAEAEIVERIDLGGAIYATPVVLPEGLLVRTEDAIWRF